MNLRNKVTVFCLLTGLLFSVRAFSQPCAEDPTKKMGTWKFDPNDSYFEPDTHPVTLKNKAKVRAVIDSIGALVKKYNPTPIGSEAKWYRSIGTEWDSITSPDPSFPNYMYNSLYLPYICSKGTIKPFTVTDTWLYVQVNGYWHSGHTLQHEFNKALDEKLFTLPPQRGTLGGYPVFEPIPKGTWEDPWLIYYSVLIHYPDKLPYKPVTIGEFFDMYEKLVVEKEKEYKAGIEVQRKNSGEEWYQSNVVRVKEQFEGVREILTRLRKLYEKELDKPAILRSWDYTFRTLEIADPAQKNFFTTANRGYQLVRANPEYMDQSREKWKPQFMWVEWHKVVSKPNSLELDKVMREKFNFQELGKMLTR